MLMVESKTSLLLHQTLRLKTEGHIESKIANPAIHTTDQQDLQSVKFFYQCHHQQLKFKSLIPFFYFSA
jgi:hypothetical protein